MIVSYIFLVILSIFAQKTTYYVSTNGSDGSTCGDPTNSCASINQVLTNYPGVSYSISIAIGTYPTNTINFQRDAFVVFQGIDNTAITASWNGIFITNTATSGFEFHDVSLVLSGSGKEFTELVSSNNSVGFYNVLLTYSNFSDGDFVDLYGGTLVVSNVTFGGVAFNGFFVWASSKATDSNTAVLITNSTFSDLDIGGVGGILVYDVYAGADSGVKSSNFTNITSDYACVGFWAQHSSQTISITDSNFFDITAYIPSVYIENDYQSTVVIQYTTWVNASSDFLAGGLQIVGSKDGLDHNITLDHANFAYCSGQYAGGVFIGFNSFVLSNGVFTQNVGEFGNDVVQELDSSSSSFGNTITNTCSSSSQPKAVVIDADDNSEADISDQIPSCRCATIESPGCNPRML